ncbi:MAG TPA: O-antigen ligase family protein [Gammaproteobacteria bacterium]|nr:O-antigen ligase family protein [Gammaproteobacteria bacterium]
MSAAVNVFTASKSREKTSRDRLGLAFWLLVLFFAFEYLRPQTVFPPIAPLRLPLLMTLLMPLVWLAVADKRMLKDRLIVLHIAFIVLIAASVLWAVNQYWVFETFKQMVAYFIAGTLPAAALLINQRRLVAFFNSWIVIHILIALWAITHEGQGMGSFLEDENDLSLALNMAIPYAYYLLQRPGQPIWRRLFYMAAVGILATAVVVSDSRGGFLGLMAVFFGIILFSRQRIRNLIVVCVLGLIGLAMVSTEYIEEMRTIADAEDSTRNDRLYSWRRGWEMFLDHPVVGVGASNYPWRVVEYEVRSDEYRPGHVRLHGGRVAHSLYFTVIPELGLVGILLFLSISWIMFRRLLELVRLDAKRHELFAHALELPLLARAMVVSMFGLLVSGAFISVLYYPHIWVLIGFTLGLSAAVASSLPPEELGAFRKPLQGKSFAFKGSAPTPL